MKLLQRGRFILQTILFLLIAGTGISSGQTVALADLSSFLSPGRTWHQAGNVNADLKSNNALTSVGGSGILINTPGKKNKGTNLITKMMHGDVDIELDFLMAKGSNSGVYLQGRYEIELIDSWGILQPEPRDVGGVNEGLEESKPHGKREFEGFAPRQNASRAPGLWQQLKISFQAPRFREGVKTENARMIKVELNGVLILENVELKGPTRSGLTSDEVASGPLMLEGDNGAVAFRNIKITHYNKPQPELSELKYSLYKGKYETEPDYGKLDPIAAGASAALSSRTNTLENEFLIIYKGTLQVREAGEYKFTVDFSGGSGSLKLNNKAVVPLSVKSGTGSVSLPKGNTPFELIYSKYYPYFFPGLSVAIASSGMRELIESDANVKFSDPIDPILIHAPVNTTLRSFMDLSSDTRITRAVNVGSPQHVHYTYDLDNGMIVQVWRGNFLDATPMWHDRGDGSSQPAGALQRFTKIVPAIKQLSEVGENWSADTSGSGFKAKGYSIDASKRPIFKYRVYNAPVTDVIHVMEGGRGLSREITIKGQTHKLYFHIAEAKNIEKLSEGLYLLNDKSYFIRIDNFGGEKPVIRNSANGNELLIPIKSKIAYSILF